MELPTISRRRLTDVRPACDVLQHSNIHRADSQSGVKPPHSKASRHSDDVLEMAVSQKPSGLPCRLAAATTIAVGDEEQNLFSIYRAVVDKWTLHSNEVLKPRVIAYGTADEIEILDHTKFDKIRAEFSLAV